MPPGPGVRDTRRGPPGDLPLDQLVQHGSAAHQPQQRPTPRVGTAVPSSVITTRPADGEMATCLTRPGPNNHQCCASAEARDLENPASHVARDRASVAIALLECPEPLPLV